MLRHSNSIAHIQSTRQRYDRNGNSSQHPDSQTRFPPEGRAVRDRQCSPLQDEDRCAVGVLPVTALFAERALTWQGVYYHFRKWFLSGTFYRCWTGILEKYPDRLDLSSVYLDGRHTPAIRGGEGVEYPGLKRRKTTNALYLTDRQGFSLSISESVAGNHNDLYEIEVQFEVVTATLENSGRDVGGLFLNADAGFGSKNFRSACAAKDIHANVCFNKRNGNVGRDEYFDQELYDERYAIEPTNAWMDSFRSLLNRFDTRTESWKG